MTDLRVLLVFVGTLALLLLVPSMIANLMVPSNIVGG